jgi:hypothetical protein
MLKPGAAKGPSHQWGCRACTEAKRLQINPTGSPPLALAPNLTKWDQSPFLLHMFRKQSQYKACRSSKGPQRPLIFQNPSVFTAPPLGGINYQRAFFHGYAG